MAAFQVSPGSFVILYLLRPLTILKSANSKSLQQLVSEPGFYVTVDVGLLTVPRTDPDRRGKSDYAIPDYFMSRGLDTDGSIADTTRQGLLASCPARSANSPYPKAREPHLIAY